MECHTPYFITTKVYKFKTHSDGDMIFKLFHKGQKD